MIKIKKATENDIIILALLGRITYVESHGQFIEDKNDLSNYLNATFSISKIEKDFKNTKNRYHIIYVDGLPVGYSKIELHVTNENIVSQNTCKLDKIYILNEFIPMKIGQQFLNFIIEKVKDVEIDTIWLSVYIKNKRAIRYYQKNEFKNVGNLNFLVNGKEYENILFSKKI